MKKHVTKFLCTVLAMVFALSALAAAPLSASAAGSPDTSWYSGVDNFTLTTVDELAGLAQLVNGGNTFAGKTITLGNDMNLSIYGAGYNSGKGWIPIGTLTSSFQGIFDGNNKKISGLYCKDSNRDNVGLFGCVFDATVKNLGTTDVNVAARVNVASVVGVSIGGSIENCYMTGTVSGSGYVGGMVGFMSSSGKIEQCYTAGTVKNTTTGYSGTGTAGGVVGAADSAVTMTNCYSTGTVSSTGPYIIVGGVVGESNECTLIGCFSTGKVSGKNVAGGVVGTSTYDELWLCYATGSVSGGDSVGGVVGKADNCEAIGCLSFGTVNGNEYVGGVFGQMTNGNATSCIATGKVSGYIHVGGAFGEALDSSVANCYATGAVTADYDVGGLIGSVPRGKIENCYATGMIIGNNQSVGGVVGTMGGSGTSSLLSCYATGAVRGQATVGGVIGSVWSGGIVANCAALNPSVTADPSAVNSSGRVVGEIRNAPVLLSGNVAFSGMSRGGGAAFSGEKTHDGRDGAGKTLATLQTKKGFPATLTQSPWTYVAGKLPGLSEEAVAMPRHLLPYIAVTSVKITNATSSMFQGKTLTLKATVSPADATNKTITWSTSDKSIATVDAKTGMVTAKGLGTATITATADGKKATCKITVKKDPVEATYVSLRIGYTKAIQNGKQTTIDNQGTKPFKSGGRTMLPIRFIGEKMGGKVTYTSATAPIYVKYGDITVELKINGKTMTVTQGKNKKTITLDVPATLNGGRVFLPLRAIGEALGFDVYYEKVGSAEYVIVSNPKMTSALRKERLNEAKGYIK